MKAISVRAPWWWFILHGGKDIENRDWATNYCGRVLLHSSKWFNLNEVGESSLYALAIATKQGRRTGGGYTFRELKNIGGCIVGSVEIVACVSSSDSPWFCGKFGFVLRDPIAFAHPIPFRGALGFFEVPDEIYSRGKQG